MNNQANTDSSSSSLVGADDYQQGQGYMRRRIADVLRGQEAPELAVIIEKLPLHGRDGLDEVVNRALDEAVQATKHLTEHELEAERVTSEIMNMRLRAPVHAAGAEALREAAEEADNELWPSISVGAKLRARADALTEAERQEWNLADSVGNARLAIKAQAALASERAITRRLRTYVKKIVATDLFAFEGDRDEGRALLRDTTQEKT